MSHVLYVRVVMHPIRIEQHAAPLSEGILFNRHPCPTQFIHQSSHVTYVKPPHTTYVKPPHAPADGVRPMIHTTRHWVIKQTRRCMFVLLDATAYVQCLNAMPILTYMMPLLRMSLAITSLSMVPCRISSTTMTTEPFSPTT